MGTSSFPGEEGVRGVTLTAHLLLVPRSKKQSRVISLISLRAFVACNKREIYLPVFVVLFEVAEFLDLMVLVHLPN
jgi:hypothetical protein